MDGEWEPEDFPEDYPEWGGFVPGQPGITPRGAALSRRFYPSRRPSSWGARPATAAAPASALDRVRQLDDRQRAIASQLAYVQQRASLQQSSDQFGPLATGAVAALALGIKSGDWFSPALISGLPALQLLVTSRGGALTAGFRTNPWSTLGFPAAALLLAVFRDQIPGISTKVAAPELAFDNVGGSWFVKTKLSPAYRVYYTVGAAPGDPTDRDPEVMGPVQVPGGQTAKFRIIRGVLLGDVSSFRAPDDAE